MQELRANKAVDVLIGPFVDSTDGDTEETGLTIARADVLLSKLGQALTQKTDVTSAAHDADGYYNCEFDATDTNTVGQMVLEVHVAGALAVRHEYMILNEAAWDAKYLAHPTAQAGTAASITLASDEVGATGDLNGMLVEIVSATGVGQAPRTIVTSTITTDVCTVAPDWITNPDATSKYRLIKVQQGVLEVDVDNKAVLPTATQASIDAIELDTNATLDNKLDSLIAGVITNAVGADIAADIIALDTVADAIKVITDQMTFGSISTFLDVNVESVDDKPISEGGGDPGSPIGET